MTLSSASIKSPNKTSEMTMPTDSDQSGNDSGFLMMCRCGGDLHLKTRTKDPFLGRLFYKCDWAGNGEDHTLKWWDKAVRQEITEQYKMLLDHEEQLKTLKKHTSTPPVDIQTDGKTRKIAHEPTTTDKVDLKYELAKVNNLVNYLFSEVSDLAVKMGTKSETGTKYVAGNSIVLSLKSFFTNITHNPRSSVLVAVLAVSILTNIYLLKA